MESHTARPELRLRTNADITNLTKRRTERLPAVLPPDQIRVSRRQAAAAPPTGRYRGKVWRATLREARFRAIISAMSILIAEDNVAQRHYLREILEKEFPAHAPVVEAADGEETVKLALEHKPEVCILDIQMPKLSGVKAARAIWRDFPSARIIFWTQFPHEIYINEIRKIVKSVDPPPAYGFIHKNNPESRFLRFVAAVLEDGADMIDPAFKDSFKRPLLTEFESEALYYLALGLSNWAIARKCSAELARRREPPGDALRKTFRVDRRRHGTRSLRKARLQRAHARLL